MTPLKDLNYVPEEHQEKGSEVWWYRRATSAGAFVALGQVSGVVITNGGSGYATAPTVGFASGGGSGAAGTALVKDGVVVAVVMTNFGTGYTSAPTVSFTPVGGGTGATGTAKITDAWNIGFGRAKSDIEYGQDETPVVGEGGNQFSTKKDDKKGQIVFTSLQDGVDLENFIVNECPLYHFAVFMHCGLNTNGSHKYRYIGIVRIVGKYKTTAPPREVEMTGIILDNRTAITVTEGSLPVAGLLNTYDVGVHKLLCTAEDWVEPSV